MTDTTIIRNREDILHLPSYEVGYQHGVDHGRQQLEDEWRGTHEISAAIARQIAEQGSYADLAERRGELDRAERQRRIVRERGIA